MYLDFDMGLERSINVAPMEQSLFVGLHSQEKAGNFGNVFLSFDMLNNLCMAYNKAEKEFNQLDANLKSKHKLKTGMLVQPDGLEYQIHEKIEKQCGRFFK